MLQCNKHIVQCTKSQSCREVLEFGPLRIAKAVPAKSALSGPSSLERRLYAAFLLASDAYFLGSNSRSMRRRDSSVIRPSCRRLKMNFLSAWISSERRLDRGSSRPHRLCLRENVADLPDNRGAFGGREHAFWNVVPVSSSSSRNFATLRASCLA